MLFDDAAHFGWVSVRLSQLWEGQLAVDAFATCRIGNEGDRHVSARGKRAR